MGSARRLNLDAIETSLRAVKTQFSVINSTLSTPRDPLSDCVLERLMLGYRQVDGLLAASVDPFAPGSSKRILELNGLVLCGTDEALREECAPLVDATAQRFYEKGDGGIEALVDWERSMHGESIWRRVGSTYIHLLSQPQLFIEGNHRTGALLMSWMLARAGKPPFVLSVDNAKAYFDPSTVAKNSRKHTLRMILERPKLVKRFADLLKQESEQEHGLA